MKTWITAALLVGMTGSANAIIDGKVDSENQFPYVTQLIMRFPVGAGSCSGELIHQRILLTDMHCFWNQKGPAYKGTTWAAEVRVTHADKTWTHNTRATLLIPERIQAFYEKHHADSNEERYKLLQANVTDQDSVPIVLRLPPLRVMDFVVVVLDKGINVPVVKTIFDVISLDKVVDGIKNKDALPNSTESLNAYFETWLRMLPRDIEDDFFEKFRSKMDGTRTGMAIGFGTTNPLCHSTRKPEDCKIDGKRRFREFAMRAWGQCYAGASPVVLVYAWCMDGKATAPGDSGGGMLMKVNGEHILVGLNAATNGTTGMSPSLYVMADWIARARRLVDTGQLWARNRDGLLSQVVAPVRVETVAVIKGGVSKTGKKK